MDLPVFGAAQEQSDTAGEPVSRQRPAIAPELRLRLARGLRIVTLIGMVFLILGTVVSLVQVGDLPRATVPPSDLPERLLAFDAQAIVSLGLLTILFAPVYGLISLAYGCLRQRDRLYAAAAGLVLTILVLSVVIALATRGA